MDRQIVFGDQLPLDTDILNTNKNAMVGIGNVIQATLGTTTLIDGFTCIPTSPATLAVQVTPGTICTYTVVDTSAYGSLAADSTPIMKMGFSRTTQNIPITPPSTTGYAQCFLVQVGFSEVDDTPVLLPYLNEADPADPFQGPANSGVQQDVRRAQNAVVALKAGVAAPSGSQVAPTADPGYYPVFIITAAQGALSITSLNIQVHPSAPFISLKLPGIPAAIQAQAGNYAVDTGTVNALVVSLPSYTTLAAGLPLRIKKGSSGNTGAATLSVNGSSAMSVTWPDGSSLSSGDWPANSVATVVDAGSTWQLQGMPGPSAFARVSPSSGPVVTDLSLVHYGVDAGTANAVSITTVSPAITTSVSNGMHFGVLKMNAVNTGTMTATISGASGSILWPDGSSLQAGDWPASAPAVLMYESGNFILMSVPGPSVYARPGGPASRSLVHYGVATGTNAMTTTLAPAITALADGCFIQILPGTTNTGAASLNPNSVGVTPITNPDGSTLTAGAIQGGQPALLMYYEGNLVLLNSAWASEFGASLNSNGYQRLPSGLIWQWGNTFYNDWWWDYFNVTFPIAFPNACLNVNVSTGNHWWWYWDPEYFSITTTGFSSEWGWWDYGEGTMYWQAIGY